MHGIKIQGKLRAYLNTPLYLTILFAILAAAAFFWNIQAGMAASVIVAVYLIVVLLMRTRLIRHIDTELMDAAALYNSLLAMQVPTPPSTQDYTTIEYSGLNGANHFILDCVSNSFSVPSCPNTSVRFPFVSLNRWLYIT